jgi:hypothetical protein
MNNLIQKLNLSEKYVKSAVPIIEIKNVNVNAITKEPVAGTNEVLIEERVPVVGTNEVLIEEVEPIINEKYNLLITKYNELTTIDTLININPLAKEKVVAEFKVLFNNFKLEHKSNSVYNLKIAEIEKSINDGFINQQNIKLFKDFDFDDEITQQNIDYLRKTLTDVVIFGDKESASESIILRAKWGLEKKPCFIKIFAPKESGLVYEQKIYRYIENRNKIVKPYYEDFFVKVYDTFKIIGSDLNNFLDESNSVVQEKGINTEIKWDAHEKLALKEKINLNTNLYFIITEDIQGTDYGTFYTKNIENKSLITNTLFDMIYALYLLNDKLNIMHNDNHFGNVLIKQDIPEKDCTYVIDKLTLTRAKNYRICIYDFDAGYLFSKPNPVLTERSSQIIQNKKSCKDIWTLVNSLWYFVLSCENMTELQIGQNINTIFDDSTLAEGYGFNDKSKYIGEIVDVILDKNPSHIKSYKDGLKSVLVGNYWNSYCINNITKRCVIPDNIDICALQVLDRFIKEFSRELNFKNVNPFYKKYLKYKNKYLSLKSQL